MGAPCGGWCPTGRLAEDGVIPARYPVEALAGAGYLKRTRQNVADSDGTLVIVLGPASGGTARTIGFCRTLGRPHLIRDAAVLPVEEAIRQSVAFVQSGRIARLNVAGPRASGAPMPIDRG